MFNTFQHRNETESRIIMDRKLRLEQVQGVDFFAATDDDNNDATSLLGDTSPSRSIEAFLDLSHPYEPFAQTESAYPTMEQPHSYRYPDTDLWSPPHPTYRTRESAQEAGYPIASTEDPFVGSKFHPVENSTLDSIPFEAGEELPYDAPETNGHGHLPYSSFFAGGNMAHPARGFALVAGEDRTIHTPRSSSDNLEQEYYRRQQVVIHQQGDNRDGKHWNQSEDLILKDAMTAQGLTVDWSFVSRVYFAGSRSANSVCLHLTQSTMSSNYRLFQHQCKHRWRKIDPAHNTASFSERESNFIIEQRAEGNSWSDISKCLNNRTPEQVKFHFEKIDPSRKKSKWGPAEDEILVAAQSRYGNKWILISETLPGRSSNDVKNRWNQLARQNEALHPLPFMDKPSSI